MAIPPQMPPQPPSDAKPPERPYMQLRPFTNPVIPKTKTLKEEPLTTPEDFRRNLEILVQRTEGKTLKTSKPSFKKKVEVGNRHLSWAVKGSKKKEENVNLVYDIVQNLEKAIQKELEQAEVDIPKAQGLLNTYYDFLQVTTGENSAMTYITHFVSEFADRIEFDIKSIWSD